MPVCDESKTRLTVDAVFAGIVLGTLENVNFPTVKLVEEGTVVHGPIVPVEEYFMLVSVNVVLPELRSSIV